MLNKKYLDENFLPVSKFKKIPGELYKAKCVIPVWIRDNIDLVDGFDSNDSIGELAIDDIFVFIDFNKEYGYYRIIYKDKIGIIYNSAFEPMTE